MGYVLIEDIRAANCPGLIPGDSIRFDLTFFGPSAYDHINWNMRLNDPTDPGPALGIWPQNNAWPFSDSFTCGGMQEGNIVVGDNILYFFVYDDGGNVLEVSEWEFYCPTPLPPSIIGDLTVTDCEFELPSEYRANIQINNQPYSFSGSSTDTWSYTVTGGSTGYVASDERSSCGRTIVIEGIVPTDPLESPVVNVTAANDFGSTTEHISYAPDRIVEMSIGANLREAAPGDLVEIHYKVKLLFSTLAHDWWSNRAPFTYQVSGSATLVKTQVVSAYDPWELVLTYQIQDTTTFSLKRPLACTTDVRSVTVHVPVRYGSWLTLGAISPDKVINKAILTLQANITETTDDNQGMVPLRIYGGDPLQPDSVPTNLTTNKVFWDLEPWIEGNTYSSPDISCVIEEMVQKGLTTLYISPCGDSITWHDATNPTLTLWTEDDLSAIIVSLNSLNLVSTLNQIQSSACMRSVVVCNGIETGQVTTINFTGMGSWAISQDGTITQTQDLRVGWT